MTTLRLRRTLRVLFCATLLAPAASLGAQTPAAPALPTAPQDTLPRDPAVKVGRLANGLTYYIRANPEPQKRAELRLVVNAGSVLEDEDQRGLAHVVEHMAFNGTRRFAKQALVDYLERAGMRFGADVNASTSFDETVYMLTLPTDSAGVLETGFDILEDWAHAVSFDSTEVEKERGVVIEEWRLGQGADTRMLNRQLPVMFRGSRYAERLPIGTRASLEGFSQEALRRFYRDWYRPELMAVVAVGDLDPARIERLIRERFSRIPPAAAPRPRPLFPVPGNAEPLVAVATDPEADYTQVSVLYKHPLRPEGTLAAYREMVVQRLYDGMLNDRLAELAQKPDPPFIGAGAGKGRFVRSAEVYSLGAGVADTGIVRGLRALLTEAERVARHGFTATELERQKTRQLRGMEMAYAERAKTASRRYASEYVQSFLTGEPAPGIAAEYALYQRLLPGIGLAEVDGLARGLLTEQNRVILVNAPEKPGVRVPDEATLLAAFGAVRGEQIAAYADAVSDAPLVESPPKPGAIVAEREIPEVGVTEWRLANGVRVLLKPTDFKDDEILLAAYSPGGSSLLPEQESVDAALAPTVIDAAGLGRLDQIALGKRLAGKAVRLDPYIGLTEEGLSGAASPKDAETLFQLVYLYFTAPRQDSAAFESLRTRFRAALENRSASPEAAFGDTLQVTLAQHHPRARPLTAEAIDRLDAGTAYRIFRDRFADAGDFTFVLVGSFDPETLRPLVQSWLGGLPATGRRESWKDVGIRPPRGVVRREVRRGVEPKSQTQIVFTGPMRYDAQSLHALRSLGDYLQIRLREKLREELSGTYSPRASGSASRIPEPRYSFGIGFGSDPGRVQELTRAVFAEIDTLRARGPAEDEVKRVQELQRRDRETSVRQNGYWLSQIAAFDQRGWELREIPTGERPPLRVDATLIQEAARRYLDPQNYVLVTLLPEAGAGAGR